MDDESLVLAVKQYRCLYDWNDLNYSNAAIRENAWKKVSWLMGFPVTRCRKKWENLRDKYRRERKKEIEAESGARRNGRPTWALLSTMSFLEPFTKSRKSTSNFDVGEGQSTPRFSSTDSGFFDASGETVLTPVLNSGTAADFQQKTGEGSKSLTSHLSNESTDNSPIFTLPGKAKKRKRVADEDDISQLVGAMNNVTEPILAKNADPDEMFLLSFSAALKSLSTQKKWEFRRTVVNAMHELLLND